MYCRYCGQQIDEDANFCFKCGARQSDAAQSAVQNVTYTPGKPAYAQTAAGQPIIVNVNNVNTNENNVGGVAFPYKSKWTAFFLCLFLGEFGIHRFYVGKTGSGLLYLFTGGLCGIGWLVDCFVILLSGFHDSMGRPLQ